MSSPEQPFKPLPVDDDVIFKLIEHTVIIATDGPEIFDTNKSPLSSTKDFVDKSLKHYIDSPQESFQQGLKAKVLEPGEKWVTGSIRFCLVVEFAPDELDSNGTSDKSVSSLDDIRNINL